jgi:hypothetical protein
MNTAALSREPKYKILGIFLVFDLLNNKKSNGEGVATAFKRTAQDGVKSAASPSARARLVG